MMTTVTQTLRFIRDQGLNHWQLKSYLWDINSKLADIPYHTKVRSLSKRQCSIVFSVQKGNLSVHGK